MAKVASIRTLNHYANKNSHLNRHILFNVSVGAISTIILEHNIADTSADSKSWYYFFTF